MADPPFVVTQTFKPTGQFQLYRLDVRARFHCVQCDKEKTALEVATRGGDWAQLVCGGCYSFLVQARREEAKKVAEAKRRSRQAKQQASSKVKPGQPQGKPPWLTAKKQQASSKVKPEQPTGLPFEAITRKERQELYRQLPGIDRLPIFFRTAGVPVEFVSGGRLWINGRQTKPLNAIIKTLDWNIVIDEMTLEYARDKFIRAVADNARFREGLRAFLVLHERGFVFMRYGVRLVLLRPTSAQIPRRDVIYANFLTSGSHWDQVADVLRGAEPELVAEWKHKQEAKVTAETAEAAAKVAAETAEAAAKAEQRLAAVRWRLEHLPDDPIPRKAMRPSGQLPGKITPRRRAAARRRIDRLPDNLAPELIDTCLEASRRIRLERQLDYERPVILECDFGELTLLPIAATTSRLCIPFHLNKGTETLKGELILAESDPLPLLIGEDVADQDALTAWICALLGFADATCIESAEPTAQSKSARQLHSTSSVSHHRLSIRALPRGRQWWPRHLEPVGHWNLYSGSYVPAHRRRLHDGWTATEKARDRARKVGITLHWDETWVQSYIRGVPDNIEMRFLWHAPTELKVFRT
jgi:hypothetical protein